MVRFISLIWFILYSKNFVNTLLFTINKVFFTLVLTVAGFINVIKILHIIEFLNFQLNYWMTIDKFMKTVRYKFNTKQLLHSQWWTQCILHFEFSTFVKTGSIWCFLIIYSFIEKEKKILVWPLLHG